MHSEKKYEFGGIVFHVISPLPMKEESRFEAFLAKKDAEADFIYEIYPKLPEQIGITEHIVTMREGKLIRAYMDISLLPKITIANFFSGAKTANLLLEKGAFILHASYVFHEGKALLFTAPSQTGKSTQAKFWEERRGTTTVNEDRVIIKKGTDGYYACGCWAMGSAGVSKNITAPIEAIILLKQGAENKVDHPRPIEILRHMASQCTFDGENKAQSSWIITAICDMIPQVTIWSFECIYDPCTVDELERFL